MTTHCYIKRYASIHPTSQVDELPYLPATEPDYKPIITNAGMRRRMSHIIKMGVAAALQCLPEDVQPEAIITATGLGCLGDTEKFLGQLLDNSEQLLNPTAFIQSTFNTIGAQVALMRHSEVYNTTYVHRAHSFENALIDTIMLLEEGYHNILTGAIDEMYQTPYQIKKRLGLLDNIRAGEGAQFFMLDSNSEDACAKIEHVVCRVNPISPQQFLLDTLQQVGWEAQSIDLWLTGENGNAQHDALYATIKEHQSTQSRNIKFKQQCGEYPTATASAVAQAIEEIRRDNIDRVVIYNHLHDQHSIILISSK